MWTYSPLQNRDKSGLQAGKMLNYVMKGCRCVSVNHYNRTVVGHIITCFAILWWQKGALKLAYLSDIGFTGGITLYL